MCVKKWLVVFGPALVVAVLLASALSGCFRMVPLRTVPQRALARVQTPAVAFASAALSMHGEDQLKIDAPVPFYLLSIFDGYGGKATPLYLSSSFHTLVMARVRESDEIKALVAALQESCAAAEQELHEAIKSRPTRRKTTPGSTASTVLVTPLWVIVMTVGDSQVLVKKCNGELWLSPGHKPDDDEETKRIEAAGGVVEFLDVPRVLWHSTARSLGDFRLDKATGSWEKTLGISAEPSITFFPRTDIDWVVMGSDGLWDGLSYELVPAPQGSGEKKRLAKTVLEAPHVQQLVKRLNLFFTTSSEVTRLSQQLVAQAHEGWLSSGRSVDDITVVVVGFPSIPQ